MIIDGGNKKLFFWEENFQDLTDWCVGTTVLPSECDFHVGESMVTKTSGMQNLSNEISNVENGVSTYKIDANFVNDIPLKTELTNILQPTIKHETEESNVISNKACAWLNQPTSKSPLYQEIEMGNTNQNDTCLPSFESSMRDNGDVLHNLNIDETDKFDLLSFLCEDEENTSTTVASTHSSSTVKTTDESKRTHERPRRSCRLNNCQLDSPKSTSSTSTSTFDFHRRLEQTVNETRQRHNRKRKLDSDSEDYDSYQDLRVKNNEASRKSRMNKKAKEYEMIRKGEQLEKDNRILKMKVEELEKLVTAMRTALLRSATRRNS